MSCRHYCLIGLAAFALLALAAENGTRPTPAYTKEEVKELVADLEAGNALSSIVVLQSLRAGNTQQAIESLEFGVDSALSSILAAHRAQPIATNHALYETLVKVKAYRDRHPRSATTNSLGQPFDELDQEIVKSAAALLESLND